MTLVYFLAAAVSIAAMVGDIITTRRGISLGATERNPIIARLGSLIGLNAALIVTKAALLAAMVAVSVYLHWLGEPWYWVAGVLAAPIPLHAYAVANNIKVISNLKDR